MAADRFESFLRSLSASPSRRGALGLLTGILLGGSFTLRADDVEAHNKLKKCKKIDDRDKRKQCLKKAKKHQAQHRQTSAPPPPVPVLAYQCPGPRDNTVIRISGPDDQERIAQTYTPAQSGSLHQIQFEITKKIAGSTGDDFVVELLAVGADGKPTNTVLATAVIPNASVPEDLDVTLTASFSGPPLVAGTEYATALRRLGGEEYEIGVRNGNDCAGTAFVTVNAVFTELAPENGSDFVTSVTVLA